MGCASRKESIFEELAESALWDEYIQQLVLFSYYETKFTVDGDTFYRKVDTTYGFKIFDTLKCTDSCAICKLCLEWYNEFVKEDTSYSNIYQGEIIFKMKKENGWKIDSLGIVRVHCDSEWVLPSFYVLRNGKILEGNYEFEKGDTLEVRLENIDTLRFLPVLHVVGNTSKKFEFKNGKLCVKITKLDYGKYWMWIDLIDKKYVMHGGSDRSFVFGLPYCVKTFYKEGLW